MLRGNSLVEWLRWKAQRESCNYSARLKPRFTWKSRTIKVLGVGWKLDYDKHWWIIYLSNCGFNKALASEMFWHYAEKCVCVRQWKPQHQLFEAQAEQLSNKTFYIKASRLSKQLKPHINHTKLSQETFVVTASDVLIASHSFPFSLPQQSPRLLSSNKRSVFFVSHIL